MGLRRRPSMPCGSAARVVIHDASIAAWGPLLRVNWRRRSAAHGAIRSKSHRAVPSGPLACWQTRCAVASGRLRRQHLHAQRGGEITEPGDATLLGTLAPVAELAAHGIEVAGGAAPDIGQRQA